MKNRGITLIALVITIIVLLILAGITISLTIGDQGVITRAQQATIEYVHSTVWEAMQMKYSDYAVNRLYVNEDFIEYLKRNSIIKETETSTGYPIDVEKLTGNKLSLGNGTDTDVYKIKDVSENANNKKYSVTYYGKSGDKELGILDDTNKETTNKENENKKRTFIIKAVDEKNVENGLDGAKIEVYKDAECTTQKVLSIDMSDTSQYDASEQIPPEGDYYVKVVDAPPGYNLPEIKKYSILGIENEEWIIKFDPGRTFPESGDVYEPDIEYTSITISQEASTFLMSDYKFVYKVEAYLDGENVYSNVYTFTCNQPGKFDCKINDVIPVGSVVKVKLENSGGMYNNLGDDEKILKIESSEGNYIAEYKYDYNYKLMGTSGCVVCLTNNGMGWNSELIGDNIETFEEGYTFTPSGKELQVTNVEEPVIQLQPYLDGNSLKINCENTGNNTVFIRVKEYLAEEGGFYDSDNMWSFSNDGYWYYNEAVDSGGRTELGEFFIAYPEEFDDSYYISVIAEAVEAPKDESGNVSASPTDPSVWNKTYDKTNFTENF